MAQCWAPKIGLPDAVQKSLDGMSRLFLIFCQLFSRNGNLQYTITGVCKEVIGFFNLVEFEAVGDQLLRIDAPTLDDIE